MADDALKALVLDAMFKGLDEKKREELLKGALATLLQSDKYGEPPFLQKVWNEQVRWHAERIIAEQIKDSAELKAQIAELFSKVVTGIMADDTVVQRMIDAAVKALTGQSRY